MKRVRPPGTKPAPFPKFVAPRGSYRLSAPKHRRSCDGEMLRAGNKRMSDTGFDEPRIVDWGYEDIRPHSAQRANTLDATRTPSELVVAVANALNEALDRDEVRIGVDSRNDKFIECRIVVQFKVTPPLYDWFFNGRTGYRAQFWTSPENGLAFNARMTNAMIVQMECRLPEIIVARRIVVQSRMATGNTNVSRSFVLQSLGESKTWICEQLIPATSGRLLNIGLSLLLDAQQRLPKLSIPRWDHSGGEGLRAPYPEPDEAWLDLKGALVCERGVLTHFKCPRQRANDLFERGWT
jgi:hypothetical protein